MGSIILFLWIGASYLLLVALITFLRRRHNWKCKKFDAKKAWDSTLGFLEGIFFESMVCVSVSFRLFDYYDYLNSSDKFSIANHMVVLVVMACFVSLITYFTVFKMPKLVALHTLGQRQKKQENLQSVRKTFKDLMKTGRGRLASSDKTRSRLEKLASLEANEVIEK